MEVDVLGIFMMYFNTSSLMFCRSSVGIYPGTSLEEYLGVNHLITNKRNLLKALVVALSIYSDKCWIVGV